MKKPKMDPKRQKLIDALSSMPDESFGWFVGWASGAMVQYPDGLGGFMPESRKSVETLRAEANAYLNMK